MKIKIIIKNLFLVILFVFFLKASLVSALEVPLPGLKDNPDIGVYVCYLFGQLANLAMLLATIAIAFGGISYLISYGRGKFTGEGKEWVKAGITGLLIIVCSFTILYTINPSLTTCGVTLLQRLGAIIPQLKPSTITPGVAVSIYKEIPIGTLTETLLTRTMDCYGFNQWGDPIGGDQIIITGKKTAGPTYTNHDRADCLAQLVDGAQKKAQVIASLSDETTKLMDTCSCRIKDDYGNDTGQSKCDPVGTCDSPTACPGGSCGGSAVGGACKKSDTYPSSPDCCPAGVKDQIEHGLINVSINASGGSGNCATQAVGYHGLDEFRCPNPIKDAPYKPCNNIVSFVESQVPVNNKAITVIDQDKWNKLNLAQQLTYFKEKIASWTADSKIKDDIDTLNRARDELASPQCYLAMPYIDLLKTYQNTSQTQKVILTQKTFTDPQTGNIIDASKYCTGFNYNNSSCFKKCGDICPDTSGAAVACYQSCGECSGGDTACLAKQETCIENCYNLRPCANYSGNNAPKNFGVCISSCQNDCSNNCSAKYLPCTDEYKFCQSQCNNNSKCVLDNAGSCLFGAESFQQCASQTTDQGNTNYCINNAYLCKNGSDQNAGYPDCVVSSSTNCSSFTDQKNCEKLTVCVWNNKKCSQNYSASFIYANPNNQKCPDWYADTLPSCQQLFPEAIKCPTASNCPDCPCDQINQNVNFSVPNTSVSDKSDPTKYNAGNEGYYTSGQKISAYQMVGPQCNGYSYNDDPLTFYCEDKFWLDPNKEGTSPTPLGTERVCPKSGEVPVGQTIDDAKNWATGLTKITDTIKQDIQQVLNQMDIIGRAKDTRLIQDYCECGAKFAKPAPSGSPICKTDCKYDQHWVDESTDADGNIIPGYWDCSCSLEQCKGSPCQQITDYLSELWNNYKQLKLDFIDFYTAMLKEPRSDIMKELTYSRQSTNNCSLVGSAYGISARILDCTRVKDEIIAPVNTGKITLNGQTVNVGCYGQDLGKAVGQSLTDNWFCCQEWSKNPTASNQPK